MQQQIYIIGAGIAGVMLGTEIQNIHANRYKLCAYVDDSIQKIGSYINNVPVIGPINTINSLIKQHPQNKVIIAMPSVSQQRIAQIYHTIRIAGFTSIQILPTMSHVISFPPHLVQTRNIEVHDLLGRVPITIDLEESLTYLHNKRIFITGAGGSIGSELSRQLLHANAQRLYLFGHGENSIYHITHQLHMWQQAGIGKNTHIIPILGDLQDKAFMHSLMRRVRADIVFHAAAYKHVPLLEQNPISAIHTNVFGTYNLYQAAKQIKNTRLILISTDKAVAPSSIYGASKRIAEELWMNTEPHDTHEAMLVRFGNVLDSRGSILPLFRQQIKQGGPITITHPDMKRFFMSIPEAVSLVLQTGGMGEHAMRYVLDMGEPISIVDMAHQLIRFYDLEPERDIAIEYIGLRDGEKLFETLTEDYEIVHATSAKHIHRITSTKISPINSTHILEQLHPICYYEESKKELYRNRHALRQIIKTVLPTIPNNIYEPQY